MTNLVEPRRAADEENDGGIGSFGDGELTTLVRRWMAAGTKVQERVRRESVARAEAEPDAESEAEVATEVEDAAEAQAEIEPEVRPDAEPVEAAVEPAEAAAEPEVQPELEAEPELEVEVEVDLSTVLDVRAEDAPEADDAGDPALLGVPRLPHRPTATDVEQATRVAVLIDARRVPEDVAIALLARLAERGAVNVCRAYADWTRADLGDWVARMRLQGLHSFHQFSDDDDQALVALAIDAVDIARDAAVDEVVIAGDMTSLLPLVHRLHAAGVRVVVVGPGHTPHGVRAACDEFWDSGSIGADALAPAGRHRA